MQEHEVTVAGNTYRLDPPFFVMATQNPIEQEGTYPLPEAQFDRFMLSINIGYPTRGEEREIVMATTQTARPEVRPVLQGPDILWMQQLVRQVPASQHMVDYAVDLARATRPKEPPSPDFVKNWLAWGAGPRAAQYMVLGGEGRGRSCTAGSPSPPRTSAPWPTRCCGIGSSPTSTPTPRASAWTR